MHLNAVFISLLIVELEKDYVHVARNARIAEVVDILDYTRKGLQTLKNNKTIEGGQILGDLIELEIPDNLVVVGDLHGDLNILNKIVDKIISARYLTNGNNKIIFLGDYVDRGSESINVLLFLLMLKMDYPHSIILMRGNHEAPAELPFSSHDLPYQVTERFGDANGKHVYGKMLEVFKELTLTTIVKGRFILVHAGLPVNVDIDNCKKVLSLAEKNQVFESTMEEILWSDPRKLHNVAEDWVSSSRGYGKYFGVSVSERWLDMIGAKVIVRGHEPCQGYRIDHEGKVLTIFSCKESYPGFSASFLDIDRKNIMGFKNAYDLLENIIRI